MDAPDPESCLAGVPRPRSGAGGAAAGQAGGGPGGRGGADPPGPRRPARPRRLRPHAARPGGVAARHRRPVRAQPGAPGRWVQGHQLLALINSWIL